MSQSLLLVKDLTMIFENKFRSFAAVDKLNFEVKQGQTLGIVGESGSGKTMSALSVMQLLPHQGRISNGEILFNDVNLLELNKKDMQKIRGNEIGMIFQDPMMSLDPVYTVGKQITEAILTHHKMTKENVKKRAIDLLLSVGIASPLRVFNSYSFELSGGMCQRVMIAIALSCNPKLLFADEPTTALDVTVQAQILDLLKKLQKENNMSIVLITHDLGVVTEAADNVIVMYAGMAIEYSKTSTIIKNPSHPYTYGLIQSMPSLSIQKEKLFSIDGMVPDIKNMPKGCRFSTRCIYKTEKCENQEPDFKEIEPNHFVRCHRALPQKKEGFYVK